MAQEVNLEGKIVYKCEKCGWLYRRGKIAEKCQAWCEKHKSCNLEIAKYAIKIK
ncbi:hypothetical protein J4456_05260 [Candidatus Pacearchaeota archaeon]|nr:hypothetical protein [Candidatus Pacearchaeota archaeon]